MRFYGVQQTFSVQMSMSAVVSELKPLLTLTEIPAQAVYDAAYRGMINAGVSRTTATNVALALKTIIGFLV